MSTDKSQTVTACEKRDCCGKERFTKRFRVDDKQDYSEIKYAHSDDD